MAALTTAWMHEYTCACVCGPAQDKGDVSMQVKIYEKEKEKKGDKKVSHNGMPLTAACIADSGCVRAWVGGAFQRNAGLAAEGCCGWSMHGVHGRAATCMHACMRCSQGRRSFGRHAASMHPSIHPWRCAVLL